MKVTVKHATLRDLENVPSFVRAYIDEGYADAGLDHVRKCVIFSRPTHRAVVMWGNRDHVRVYFEEPTP